MTIAEILAAEPKLRTIAATAAAMPKSLMQYAYLAATTGADGLVGPKARNPALRTEGAQDTFLLYLRQRIGLEP